MAIPHPEANLPKVRPAREREIRYEKAEVLGTEREEDSLPER